MNKFDAFYQIFNLIIYTFFTFALYFFSNRYGKEKIEIINRKRIFYSIIGFLLLNIIALIIFIFVYRVKTNTEFYYNTQKPTDYFGWCFFIINTAAFAFFEEFLYRLFLPDVLFYNLLKKICIKKKAAFFFEFITVFLFAISHYYLGIYACINAFFCGIILRFVIKKTGTVWSTCFIHFIYNLEIFAFYFSLQ